MRKKIMIGLLLAGMLCSVPTAKVCASSQTDIEETQEQTTEEMTEEEVTVWETEETVTELGKEYAGILQVLVTCTDDAGAIHPIQGGTGFLIGDGEEAVQYLVTSDEVITVSDEKKQQLRELYSIESENIQEEIAIIVKRDVTIQASVVISSAELDFAILRLEQQLYDGKPFILYDGELQEYQNGSISALGYPAASTIGEDIVYYTDNDINVTTGTLLGESKLKDEYYIIHNIVPTIGNIGGAIVNDRGEVIAINQSRCDENGYYALQMKSIISVMDALGIPYKTSTQVAEQVAAEQAAIVHKENLEIAIMTANGTDLSMYKKKTVQVLTEALEKALEVDDNEAATQEEVDAAEAAVTEALGQLEMKTPLILIIVPVLGGIVIIIFIILCIVVATKPKRDEKKRRRIEELTVTEPAPVFEQNRNPETPYQALVGQNGAPASESPIWNQMSTVTQVNEDAGTQVLSNMMPQQVVSATNQRVLQPKMATLISESTGANIVLNKPVFTVGKDQEKTDYCIHNNAVSRVHAVFTLKQDSYYLVDKNTTNGTYINGIPVVPGQEQILHNGDRIRLANEEFRFKF